MKKRQGSFTIQRLNPWRIGGLLILWSFFLTMIWISGIAAAEKAEGESAGQGKVPGVAVLNPTQGNQVRGTAWFLPVADGVRVMAEVEGLTPGRHGFHIHEYGDCHAPDASSAGGHYNPLGAPHGGPKDEKRHVGDLGNIEANEQGRARFEWVDSKIDLAGRHSIIGRAVVVHAKEDDLKSQPSGDAGDRLACGVIGLAQPPDQKQPSGKGR